MGKTIAELKKCRYDHCNKPAEDPEFTGGRCHACHARDANANADRITREANAKP